MNISRNLIATIHITAMIAAGTVPAVAAGGTFAADAAGTEGRALRSVPTRNTIHPIVLRGGRGADRGRWYISHRDRSRRGGTMPVIVTPVR